MAETAVGFVINNLIPLLAEEAYLLSGVHNDIEQIKCDLDYNMATLKDADERAQIHQRIDNNHGVKMWVEKLRRASFERKIYISVWYDPRKHSCFLKEIKIMGIEDSRDELIQKVNAGSSGFIVISLVGMGGLEDHSIRSGRLIQQWIPEGFVKSKRDKTLKGTTPKEYLIELINRNLIQVSKTTIIGKAKTFRIHDLLSYECIQSSAPELAQVRSLFIFVEEGLPHNFVSDIPINFKLLKVLDFEDAPNLDHLPKNIGTLFHLKYLSFRKTKVKNLPKLIGRNVVGYNIFEELKKLVELRTFQVTMLRSEDNKEFCDCIQKMSHLESLSVSSISENEIIDLESLSSQPQYLENLYLQGPLFDEVSQLDYKT
ncbi:hypothetical protein G4B88_016658 [Cannabis sativa]|uniref:Uncharacterized protein n=1 Tax=Cannabis sativa TaxID=3483 RepID=A0A7J6H9R4_CANSA|nr:hypothetical protein G4B88_016658 [Cannabis sativa]